MAPRPNLQGLGRPYVGRDGHLDRIGINAVFNNLATGKDVLDTLCSGLVLLVAPVSVAAL